MQIPLKEAMQTMTVCGFKKKLKNVWEGLTITKANILYYSGKITSDNHDCKRDFL
jgi:hypothetical protein